MKMDLKEKKENNNVVLGMKRCMKGKLLRINKGNEFMKE
jgi:hypothetical protein